MSHHFMTIHVLAAGDLFADVLNAITAFMSQNDFLDLLRITALIGIVMVTVGFLKSRDPMVFAKWFFGYVLCTNLLLIPKTSVLIEDISTQKIVQVGNVPVVFALTASLLTSLGYGLAESYDTLFATPGDFAYTKTGALFGAKLIESAHDFRIIDPTLKDEMDHYFRSCVVGDIRINQKYSVGDLATSTNIWDVISRKASPLRMTEVNGALVTCQEASRDGGLHSLKARLDAEIHKTYSIFGINLFGKQKKTAYESLFETHLTSAAKYYQGLTDTSSNIFLQAMMINAMGDGINHYQAFTDNTASVVNHEFTKSQLQHRWSWDILGLKAVWFLPLLHTNLLLILFGVFPLVLALGTMPGGGRIFTGYLQFFLSLQCWPVLFAVINHGMTKYGMDAVSSHGAMTMVNLDKMTELSRDISGVAGYIMAMIPFIAKGLVSNLGEAFNGLATSITGHVQGSGMAVAGEAASASFGLGQTSFYNTTANNMSANKHDTNWTNMHGMHSEQAGSGVIKTITGSGETVFDVSPGMTKGAVHISDTHALSGSLNEAYDTSKQATQNESQHLQSSVSNAAHRALQLTQLEGTDMRFGDGVSRGESSQFSAALSTMSHVAEEVAKRTGVTKEDAFARLASSGINAHAGASISGSVFGIGGNAGVDTHLKGERSSTLSNRESTSFDSGVTARDAADFNKALNTASHFAETHHFDESQSKGASLSNQFGADLREAQTASHNIDASLSRSARIHEAQSYVESKGSQVTADLNQAFPKYVEGRVGRATRDELFEHPGDISGVGRLESLGQDFIAQKREALIAEFGNKGSGGAVDALYHEGESKLNAQNTHLNDGFQHNSATIRKDANGLGVEFSEARAATLKEEVGHHITNDKQELHKADDIFKTGLRDVKTIVSNELREGHQKATEAIIPGDPVGKTGRAVQSWEKRGREHRHHHQVHSHIKTTNRNKGEK